MVLNICATVSHLLFSKLREIRQPRAVLKDELETSMRLCGITSLSEAKPSLVNTLDVDYMIVSNGKGRLLSKL
ncbi:hypothetical protein BKA59DRAFT_488579 [Fusarium tricinctum]|jgi:hypothetical protein|uniref:Uncharacterized protein n=1 Tax=Fusarium tricinctum TaxID=61284 RepID=A0A8K0RJG9_9HYPO|nr:hypothetical protein BKA59DRAFT_488579 [Fusarium tricinctum]